MATTQKIDVGEWLKEKFVNLGEKIKAHFEEYDINRAEVVHKFTLTFIFVGAFLLRILPVAFGNPTIIKAFDPHMQLRSAEYIRDHGFLAFLKWYDYASWYPYGRDVGSSMYVIVPLSALVIYNILQFLGFNVALGTVAWYAPAVFGSLGVVFGYLLTKELVSRRAGVFVALLLATSPGYLSRTMGGFFDNESVGVMLTLMTLYFFVRAMNRDSAMNGLFAGFSLAMLSWSWGAYRFTVDFIPVFVLIMIITGKANYRLLKAYVTTIAVAFPLMIMLPRIGGEFIFSIDGMAPLFTLVVLILFLMFKNLEQDLPKTELRTVIIITALAVVAAGGAVAGALVATGVIQNIGSKFLNVIIPTIRNGIPILDSVSEHLPMSWSSLYLNIGVMAFFTPMGVYYALKKPTEKNLFILSYSLITIYFSGSMVRLILLLTPAAALTTGLAIDNLLIPYALAAHDRIKLSRTTMTLPTIDSSHALMAYVLIGGLLLTNTWSGTNLAVERFGTSEIYPSPNSKNPQPFSDWVDALAWIRSHASYKQAIANNERPPVFLSWWDYGYWLTTKGEAETLVDNATINSTQIGTVGAMLMLNVSLALPLMYKYGVQYVVVNSAGGSIGSGSDIGKAIWMIRISEKNAPQFGINEDNYWDSKENQYKDAFYDSVLWQLISYRTPEMSGDAPIIRFDGTIIRNGKDKVATQLDYFVEVFRSRGIDPGNEFQFPWVRIYKVVYPDNILSLVAEFNEMLRLNLLAGE